jgi:hypothetical protein
VNNDSVISVTATTAGKLVGTYAITGDGGTGPNDSTIDRKAIYSFADTGDALVPTLIPGTDFSPGTVSYPTSLPIGYNDFTPKADGSIAAIEIKEAADRRMITLDPSNANASGFVVNSTILTIPFVPVFSEFDLSGDRYFSTNDTLFLSSGDDPYVPSVSGPTVRGVTGGDGHVYAFTGASSPYKLAAYSAGAFSPTITTDPAPQSLTVASNSETKSVTLHSGATGTPNPTGRWQKQLAGSLTWDDIPGETGADLTFGATAANNGDSYRAVYTNAAGEIATASALLTVTTVAGPAPPAPPANPIGVPAPAAPVVKNGKSVKLKYKKGKSARVAVGSVTCASTTTCVYTLPATIKFKIGTKSYKAKVAGPGTLEPGQSQTIYATVTDSAIKKLKGKKSKLVVPVQVANSVGVLHSTTMSIISKISA